MINYKQVKNLYVLPFDHRSGFAKMLGFDGELNSEQTEKIKEYKRIIYESIVLSDIPKSQSAVLVDEIYGLDILKEAKREGYITMQTVEKSGQDTLQFEYGEDYQKHILDIMPTYAKVLVRYDVKVDSKEQIEKLKELSRFVHDNNIGLLIEPLMQKEKDVDQIIYDTTLRYKDLIKMIDELGSNGVGCDVLKIEGLYEKKQYEEVVLAARKYNKEVNIIILGRNETKEHVIEWIKAGRDVDGVAGFAIGRTIFWNPLTDYSNGKITRDEVKSVIAKEYNEYYEIFINKNRNSNFLEKIKNIFN